MKLIAKIAKLLTIKKQTLATVESCTGGKIASLITVNAGASRYYKGGIIAYHSQVKANEVGVLKKTMQDYSVVSEQVALEMATGIQKKFCTQYAIATTGNAGPTTDDTDESVGVVFMAIATPKGVFVQKNNFLGTRKQVIKKASCKALEFLYQEILKN